MQNDQASNILLWKVVTMNNVPWYATLYEPIYSKDLLSAHMGYSEKVETNNKGESWKVWKQLDEEVRVEKSTF